MSCFVRAIRGYFDGSRVLISIKNAVILIFLLPSLIYILLYQRVYDHDKVNVDLFMDVRNITNCTNRNTNFRIEQRGDFYCFTNFIQAIRQFSCHESITYTTHGEYTFLDNVPTLAKIWNGPISVAVYAPADDFLPTLQSIAYLRNCETTLIKMHVTFHIILLSGHFPQKISDPLINLYEDYYDCKKKPPYYNIQSESLYRYKNKLMYPINIARNIARQTASTHFVFASDIELYPSPNFIEKFLAMIANNSQLEHQAPSRPRVYAFPIFEVVKNASIPETKTQLQEMVKKKTAIPFHMFVCPVCHTVPKHKEWMAAPETEGLQVFTVGKRKGSHKYWEAFYVGTHADPLFDERLSLEGLNDKMTQGFTLCLLDYDYMVFDNAFLVHKPGIKKSKKRYDDMIAKTSSLIAYAIRSELIKLYGFRMGCEL